MKRHLVEIALFVVLATVAAGYIAAVQPTLQDDVFRAYAFVVGALLMFAILTAAGDALPRRRRSALDVVLSERPPRDRPLPELERAEREVTLGTSSAYDLHNRLLPQLREIASYRLEREGKEPSPQTLGRWWELLRPDRPEPEDRFARGIPAADLAALVAELEAMGR